MTDPSFPFSLRLDSLRRYSIIRFPPETVIYQAVTGSSSNIRQGEFYSITRTPKEITVVQNAKYPPYPQELGDSLAEKIQIEEGFVLVEVIPMSGTQIDFGIKIRSNGY